jgi:hypothetical protein
MELSRGNIQVVDKVVNVTDKSILKMNGDITVFNRVSWIELSALVSSGGFIYLFEFSGIRVESIRHILTTCILRARY